MPLGDWLKNAWGIVAGFLGAIAAIMAAVASATEHPQRFFAVAALLAAAAVLIAALYVALSRRTELGQSYYRFSRWFRFAGLCGAVVVGLLIVYAAIHPESRDAWLSAFRSPRAEQPFTVPRRPPHRVVIVAEFAREGADDQAIQIRRRVVSALNESFAQSRIEGVKIVEDSTVIRSQDEADRLLAERRADALIWGFSDSELLGVDVALSRGASRVLSLTSEHVPWHVEDPAASLGVR